MLEMLGLVKLVEECGEVTQIAAKKMARMDSDEHWDGGRPLSTRMEEEMGDLLASIEIVAENFKLDANYIAERKARKMLMFREWMKEEDY